MDVRLIGLDWGTTALRAYCLGENGHVLATRALAKGIMNIAKGGFEQVLHEACGDWRELAPQVPVVACGMVGSAQGWREAPYCMAPASPAGVAAGLVRQPLQDGGCLHIIPGVLQDGALPNVMRGEETQVFGLLQTLAQAEGKTPWLIGLPGTHSKWVQVEEGCIRHFDTFMTGELFAVACQHTILGRTQAPSEAFQQQAFDRGVAVARSAEGRLGLLATLFSARTLGLTNVLAPHEQADYLSGLMIGHEVAALVNARPGATSTGAIALIGSPALCQRYQRVLHACGFANVRISDQATELGLWSLAAAAGLVQPDLKELTHVAQ
ncbi:2-dehydro-3-deoxygalactonokinase [Pseudomonas massiliensis]|uniref:2-dehydro-3-deoxygalactonokinase n=1 Tax=Pseudomonas massiliensis TaxID=522492 RepID=UPI00058E58CE|nr:2-dehydro-3-deoxygalactonokinase [Pseudomonas massiliensis]